MLQRAVEAGQWLSAALRGVKNSRRKNEDAYRQPLSCSIIRIIIVTTIIIQNTV